MTVVKQTTALCHIYDLLPVKAIGVSLPYRNRFWRNCVLWQESLKRPCDSWLFGYRKPVAKALAEEGVKVTHANTIPARSFHGLTPIEEASSKRAICAFSWVQRSNAKSDEGTSPCLGLQPDYAFHKACIEGQQHPSQNCTQDDLENTYH